MINRLKNSEGLNHDLKDEHVNIMTIILVLFKSIFQRLEMYLTNIIISISLYDGQILCQVFYIMSGPS